jgi:hypothetical protein
MNTATANLIVVTAALAGNKITGTALDGDICVLFSAEASEVNQQVLMPEANLVVTGKFRLGREVCTVGMCIKSIIAVVSLPTAAPNEVTAPIDAIAAVAPSEIAVPVAVVATAAPNEVAAPVDVAAAATKKRKTSTARSKKKATTELVAA